MLARDSKTGLVLSDELQSKPPGVTALSTQLPPYFQYFLNGEKAGAHLRFRLTKNDAAAIKLVTLKDLKSDDGVVLDVWIQEVILARRISK